jgi:hypothetical protein
VDQVRDATSAGAFPRWYCEGPPAAGPGTRAAIRFVRAGQDANNPCEELAVIISGPLRSRGLTGINFFFGMGGGINASIFILADF